MVSGLGLVLEEVLSAPLRARKFQVEALKGLASRATVLAGHGDSLPRGGVKKNSAARSADDGNVALRDKI